MKLLGIVYARTLQLLYVEGLRISCISVMARACACASACCHGCVKVCVCACVCVCAFVPFAPPAGPLVWLGHLHSQVSAGLQISLIQIALTKAYASLNMTTFYLDYRYVEPFARQ